MPSGLLSGWLKKRGAGEGLLGSTEFRHRWFVLDTDGTVRYFKAPPTRPSDAPQGSFSMRGGTVRATEAGFEVDAASSVEGKAGATMSQKGRTYYVQADSVDVRDLWLAALSTASNEESTSLDWAASTEQRGEHNAEKREAEASSGAETLTAAKQGVSATVTLVQASEEVVREVVPLASHEKMLATYFNVTFALLYPGAMKASPTALARALAKVLSPFKALAGRLVLNEGLAIDCNNAGVPLTHCVRVGPSPSFATPIPADLFDMEVGSVPTGEGAGEAPMRVKVTDFDDAQVFAISINHGLCDASGLGAFMSAWAAAYTSGSIWRSVSNDRIGTAPPTPEMGAPALSPSEDIPTTHPWRTLRHLPEQCPVIERVPLASPAIFSNTKSVAECRALKVACLEVAGTKAEGGFVSTNDAVCAELAASLGHERMDHVPVGLLMDYRPYVGGEGVLGNLWFTLELLVRSSLAGAVDIRKALPNAQSAAFVRWLAGQGANPAWPGVLMMNTWTKALKLAELTFEVAVADVMVGAPMLEQRLAMMAPAGVSYAITLPQVDGGIKSVGVLPAHAAEKLTGTVCTLP